MAGAGHSDSGSVGGAASRRTDARIFRAPAFAVLTLSGLLAAGPLACGGAADDYFPLNEGWIYAYRVESDIQSVGKEVAKILILNRGGEDLDGERVAARMTHDGRLYYYVAGPNGVALVAEEAAGEKADVLPPGQFVLKFPLAKGTSWRATTVTRLLRRQGFGPRGVKNIPIETPIELAYTIESTDDTVTVPAGIFHRCVKVHAEGTRKFDLGEPIGTVILLVKADEWYARGVGLVKLVRNEDATPASPVSGTMVRELERLEKPGWFE
ncbi:MAG: hypothetical protein WCF16_10845 [Alphaproteobacteria bacterium]